MTFPDDRSTTATDVTCWVSSTLAVNVASCPTPHPGEEYWNETPDNNGCTVPSDRSTEYANAPRSRASSRFTRLPGSTLTAANFPSPDTHSYPYHVASSNPPGSITATSDHTNPSDSRATCT